VPGHVPCEFVSGVYRGTAGLVQLAADVRAIKALGARVNQSCGLHIHVGFDKSDAEKMDRLVTLIANFEKAIYAATGTKRREVSRWCRSLHRYGNKETAKAHARNLRYHVLNIATGGKPTVEFRAFGASLNVEKIVTYVRLCVGLVERAIDTKRVTDWTAKTPKETSPIHRSGEGHTAVTRLFYQLGWTKGRISHTYGNLVGEGLPSIKASKAELVRLAKKYDAGAAESEEHAGNETFTLRIPRPRRPRRARIRVGYQVRVNYPGHWTHDRVALVRERCRHGWWVEVALSAAEQAEFVANGRVPNDVLPARFLTVVSEVSEPVIQ
jgi:hypothetical protein